MPVSKGFLTQQGYIWSVEKDEELRKRLVLKLKEIAWEYSNKAEYKEALRILKLLAVLVPYDEEVNYKLLKTLENLEDYEGILNHYQRLKKLLKDEYDTVPSDRISRLASKQ